MSVLGKRNRDVDFSELPKGVLKLVMDKYFGSQKYWRNELKRSFPLLHSKPLTYTYVACHNGTNTADIESRFGFNFTDLYNLYVDMCVYEWDRPSY